MLEQKRQKNVNKLTNYLVYIKAKHLQIPYIMC